MRALSLLLLCLSLVAACGDKDGDTADTTDTSDTTDTATDDTTEELDGATLFADYCATCHGDDGAGTRSGPDIRAEVTRRDDAFLIDVILNGRERMRAVDVSEAQATNIVAWMRDTF